METLALGFVIFNAAVHIVYGPMADSEEQLLLVLDLKKGQYQQYKDHISIKNKHCRLERIPLGGFTFSKYYVHYTNTNTTYRIPDNCLLSKILDGKRL